VNFRACLMLLAFTLAGCTAQTEAACTGHSIEEYLGVYTVSRVERFRGGLTEEGAAKDRLGDKVIVLKDQLSSKFYSNPQPRYEISCHAAKIESGAVPSERWSNFYGLGLNRRSIDILEVYSPSDKDGEPSYYFEIVDGTLWELFDGWKYELQREE